MARTFLFQLEQKEFMAGAVILALSACQVYVDIEPGDPPEFPKPCVYVAPNCSGCCTRSSMKII